MEDICFKFKFMIINLSIIREDIMIINLPLFVKDHVHVSRTIKGLANPNVLRMRAFGTYTRGPHVKQDNKLKLIIDHKRFIISHKRIKHKLHDVDMFCELCLCLLGESSSEYFIL